MNNRFVLGLIKIEAGKKKIALGLIKEAIEDFDEAIKIDSTNVNFLLLRAEALKKSQQWEKAINDLTDIIQIEPQNRISLFERGDSFCHLKKYAEGIKDFTTLIKIDPAYPGVFFKRADAFYHLNRYDEAQEDWKMNNCFELVNRGKKKIALGLIKEAIEDFDEAIKIDSTNVNFLLLRAEALKKSQQWEKAINDLTDIIQIEPQNRISLFERGDSFCHLKKYAEGIKDFTTLIKIDPAYPGVFFKRADAFCHLHHYAEAYQDYCRYIKLNPNCDTILQKISTYELLMLRECVYILSSALFSDKAKLSCIRLYNRLIKKIQPRLR